MSTQIFVKGIDGKSVGYMVNGTDTVKSLKQRIEERDG
jgi:hypothetical protein